MIEKRKSELVERKFVDTFDTDGWEILTDSGFVDTVSLHKTVPYLKYSIKTKNGLMLECADDHIVFTDSLDEVFVKDLAVGDLIMTEDGVDEIVECENCGVYENMYDFELADESDHRYYTNGILNHNTFMLKMIANLLNVPYYIADATGMTAAGYVGNDVESMITGLLKAANHSVKRTQIGICVIDEIDKIARKGENVSITRDVSGEDCQQGMLKILESTVVGDMPNGGRLNPTVPLTYVDTTNILFIGLGAFEGMERLIAKRLTKKTIGFNNFTTDNGKVSDSLAYVTPADFRAFGMIPELVGRFPIPTP